MKQAVELMKELKEKKQRDKDLAAAKHAEEQQKKTWSDPSNYKFW